MKEQKIKQKDFTKVELEKILDEKSYRLKKLERELEIETALERIRARTMAMQKSEELSETVFILFQQFKQLGENPDQATIGVINENEKVIEYWVTMYGNPINKVFKFSLDEPNVTNKIYKAWKENKKSLVIDLSGNALAEFMKYRAGKGGAAINSDEKRRIINVAFFSKGLLNVQSNEERSEESIKLLERFASVFEQTYTRFLDLQKAEAQTREAEIQLALERVRARTMAMQKQNDLLGVLDLLVEQLLKLGVNLQVANFSNGIPVGDWDLWIEVVAGSGTIFNNYVHFPRIDHPYFHNVEKNIETFRKDGTDLFKDVFSKEEKDSWQDYINAQTIIKDLQSEEINPSMYDKPGYTWSMVILKDTWVSIGRFNTIPFSGEEDALLRRFANAFGQTYTRFLDLQKAEAQAREAQIQLALERVRARTMAMHQSNELAETALLLFQQLQDLGLSFSRTGFYIWQRDFDLVQGWVSNGALNEILPSLLLPFKEDKGHRSIYEASLKGELTHEQILTGEELKRHYQWLMSQPTVPDTLRKLDKSEYALMQTQYKYAAIFKEGYLLMISAEPQLNAINLLKRFAKVFDQTYTRFLDLKKVEAQAREAKIEAALEKVRSRSMGMQKSEELKEVIQVIYEQFIHLNIHIEHTGFILDYKTRDDLHIWLADKHLLPSEVTIPWFDSPPNNSIKEAKEKGQDFFKYLLTFEEKNKFYRDLFKFIPGVPEETLKYYLNCPGLAGSGVLLENIGLYIENFDGISYTDEENAVLMRFGKVFEQTYTRFLDLQKAEAQAKEAQIQLALERVRARTMSMQKSDELAETASVLFQQMNVLGNTPERLNIGIINEEKGFIETWATEQGGNQINHSFNTRLDEPTTIAKMYEGWKAKKASMIVDISGKELKQWIRFLQDELKMPVNEEILQNRRVQSVAYFKEGFILMTTPEPLPAETISLLERFAEVFNLTYTRFLDLQKAEAQAREAKIEAGLERVRSRAMAMQTSEELRALIGSLFTELTKLDLQLTRCVIWIFDAQTNGATWWMANSENPQSPINCEVPFNTYEPYLIFLEQWKKKTIKFQYELKGKIKKDWDNYLFNKTGLSRLPDFVIAGMRAPECVLLTASFNNFGALNSASLKPLSDEHADIMLRFAKVFDLTYTRFNDLKQAEAQAREAKIEASLERVRGKAMSMHSSRDLADTIEVFYHEIELLSITPRRCGVGLMDKETHFAELSTMNTTERGESIEIIGKLKMAGHPVLEGVYDNWILQKEYHPVLRGNEIKEYYKLIRPQIAYPDYPTDMIQYGYFFFFNEGGVYAWTEKELSEDELKIYRRFTSVLSLTYKRYKDLKDAEANTREAIKRASLDRVRAETASMRTTGDLERITPLIWNELTTLGVPFIRCGVFIMDEQQEQIHSFLSTPDGKAIAAFQLPYDSAGELSKVLAHWHKKEIYKDHWDEATFAAWTKSLVQQGAIASEEKYSTAHRPVNLDLHFLPFLQGMLYVGSEAPLSDEEIHLVQTLADAFSTAYARYEDFNKLESAKAQIEKTLTDLKQAQAQLVQSEKMASLGELTAGIAHEIQNPLNFVNNFSEVSNELIDEMKQELSKANYEEANLIADDLKQNLEKINHHGKRAGDIVKGMLQHSRTSTGVKEPTDINALADEYLRLSYHGLRAKDKSFNAEMKTDFDASIGNINIIPQDIGRVLLNLFNNAFYAVNQQKSQNLISYEPTVSVSTKKEDNHVLITVSDNGNGVPKNIVDKIFQPFFTTKPTGQGTGLGLSLSYDIIKAHGGTLKVESTDGEGSEFIIYLPIN